MDFLSQILEYKTEQIKILKKRRSEASLRNEAEQQPLERRPFVKALDGGDPETVHIIAEIKRASPSKGFIRPDLDPAAFAQAYARGGASAISVLTEDHWFKGSMNDLADARAATPLPVLRKDFILSSYQIFESAAMGADAVLLIVRILSETQLKDFLDLCAAFHMDALVEIHTPEDARKIKDISARLIGINNRNLRSFDTDIRRAWELAAGLRPDQIPVAASGISSPTDVQHSKASGIRHFLVGESIVRSDDPEGFLRSLKEQTEERQ
jgi:indole-3-glycerol phosphate synthase